MATTRGGQPNPASNIISGTVDTGSTWYEDIELTQNGEQLTGVSDHAWTMEFYKEPGCSADLSLSTSASTLTISEGASSTILGIRCAPSRFDGMCGDYWCDLKSTDSSPTVDSASRVYLWGRGIVTFVEGAD